MTDWKKILRTDFPNGILAELSLGDPETDPLFRVVSWEVVDEDTVYLRSADVDKAFVVKIDSYVQRRIQPPVYEVTDKDGETSWRWAPMSKELHDRLVRR